MSESAQIIDIRPGETPSPTRFINRELSWLAFNERVLAEAENLRHPLLERLRFLSISASNLDEFYMVRVAGLKGQCLAGIKTLSQDGLTPAQQLDAIDERAGALMEAQQVTWMALRAELAEAGIAVVEPTDLEPGDRAWLEERFMADLFPVLTPLALDPAHPFPFVANRGFGLALQLDRVRDGERLQALILIPALGRSLRPAARHAHPVSAGREDDRAVSRSAVPRFRGRRAGRLPRAARQRGRDRGGGGGPRPPVRDRAEAAPARPCHPSRGRCPDAGRSAAVPQRASRGRSRPTCSRPPGILGLDDTRKLIVGDERPDLIFPPYVPRFPERIRDFGGDCFAAIRQKDIVVHHPYESFDVVVQFLRQAARDPAVVAIKQTLYRTSEGQSDRPRTGRGGGSRQVGHRDDRIEGALRRGGEYPLGA